MGCSSLAQLKPSKLENIPGPHQSSGGNSAETRQVFKLPAVCARALISGDRSRKLTSLPTCSRPTAKSHMPFRWTEHEVTSLINCERRGGVGGEGEGEGDGGQDIMRPLLILHHLTFFFFFYKPFSSWTMMDLEWLVVSPPACHWHEEWLMREE